ncbi:hypothetical protein F5Y17DRAFT_427420 [Xylariaceae sp. FL0594]|nr:hypothetical protein F5Y17DRAFT_427420 [Xylariaceae sp. FL0594]
MYCSTVLVVLTSTCVLYLFWGSTKRRREKKPRRKTADGIICVKRASKVTRCISATVNVDEMATHALIPKCPDRSPLYLVRYSCVKVNPGIPGNLGHVLTNVRRCYPCTSFTRFNDCVFL